MKPQVQEFLDLHYDRKVKKVLRLIDAKIAKLEEELEVLKSKRKLLLERRPVKI